MNTAIWVALSFSIVLASAPITGGGKKVNERQLAKFVARHGLPLPVTLRDVVLRRVHARERTTLAWGVGGIAIGAIASTIVSAVTGTDGLGAVLVMIPAALGASLGSYVGVLRAPDTLRPDAPRIARSHSVRTEDYSTAGERWATRLVIPAILAALVAALIVWFLAPAGPAEFVTPLVMVASAAAVAVVCLLLGRARSLIVDRPQHAHDDLELAWDDALRASAVRDVQDSAVASGMLATLGLIVVAGLRIIDAAVGAGAEGLTLGLGILLAVVGLACWTALIVPWAIGRDTRNPSLHLWSGAPFLAVP